MSGLLPGDLGVTGVLAAASTQPASSQAAAPSLLMQMFPPGSVALTVLLVSLVAASGLALGNIRLRGFSLGIPGVMFTGLLLGKYLPEGLWNREVMIFIRDFGLILFVYAVGVQVGPGFFASLRSNGLRLNLMAVAVVLLGAILTIAIARALPRIGMVGSVGLFAGATTNAPAFASASEVLRTLDPVDGRAKVLGLTSPAFAISYPFGLLGVILAMVALRALFKLSPAREAELAEAMEHSGRKPPATLNVELQNANFSGLTVDRLEELQGHGIVISRVLHAGALSVARPSTTVQPGDVVLAVGTPEELEAFRLIAGRKSELDLKSLPGAISTREILVTHRRVLGRSVDDLSLAQRLDVTITRVRRGTLEFTAVGSIPLQFGDRVLAVGEASELDEAAAELGNSIRELNLPRLLPIFLGLALGVTLGSIPFAVPGLPVAVKLGLAAGPMIVAIVLARIGRLGSLLWYMPHGASGLMRELGITLFLIAVGILAGEGFFQTVWSLLGLQLLLLGAMITLVPLLLVGLLARRCCGTNYLHICGMLAGSMTSPSLAFTHTMTASEAPAVAFATVYPLTMILRVLVGQLLVLLFH